MLQVLDKTDAKVDVKADQSMQALVGLINQNINDPVSKNISQNIEKIESNVQFFREKIAKDIQVQGSKVDKKLKGIQDLLEDKHDTNLIQFATLQKLISDFEKNNFENMENSFEKIDASFDALALDIGTNKNTLLEAVHILEQQLIACFSVKKTALLSHVDVQFLKVLNQLEAQHKYQTDQWHALFEALEIFSNQHINMLEIKTKSISTLLIHIDENLSSKQDHAIEQITQQIKSSYELLLSEQQAHVNQLQEVQQQYLDQQALDFKEFYLQINQKFNNHKNTQIISLGISVINLLLISIIFYFCIKW